MERISFQPEGEDAAVMFYVLEQTVLNGITYLLVTDVPEGDGEAWILKDTSSTDDPEAVYEMVDEESELSAVGAVFASLLDDVDLT